MNEISKKYLPGEIEDKWYAKWMEKKLFKSVPDERTPYTIVIPPPNVTGVLHMGHMLNNTIQDVLIRRKRMQGFNACWVPGTDHASIATEAKVVKMLADEGVTKEEIGREKFLERAMEWKDKYGGIILSQLRKLGASCDWDRTTFTMDPTYYKEVVQVFCDLFDKGYIYRGIRMVNWDPAAQTAVSDEEVIHKDIDGQLYHIRYQIEGSDEYVTVATTRPETILGDSAISVHPEDERYMHLHGKKAIVPLINRAIPIITDDYVDIEFGTGCLKVTPAHDINDYEIGLRHNLPSIDVLNPDGTISEAGELYIGEDRFVVRKKISKELDATGHLVEKKQYRHSVGHSERTDAVIEPRLSLQWFMKMEDISKPALDVVLDGEVKLIPEKFINTYRHWMENVRDWCLSRQLWWGQQIPAYYIRGNQNDFVVGNTKEEALAKAKTKLGDDTLILADLEQDPDVLDTWASSWLWPITVFNGLSDPDNEEINYYYPTDDLVTAPEILFFWVARMIIAGKEYKQEIPFKNVYLTGIVRDKQRRKMSKSLGNSPDPLDLIAQYGAGAVRVGMLLSSPAGNDLLFDEGLVEQGSRFANKMWNAYGLVKGWEIKEGASSPLDKQALNWIQNRMKEVGHEIDDHFSKFRLSDALMSIYKLVWDDFCSWYLEMIKPPYGEAIVSETHKAVVEQFETLMKMVHPFMPFITEEIYQGFNESGKRESICISAMPNFDAPDAQLLAEMELINETVTAVRKFRNDKGLSPKDPIELYIKTTEQSTFEKYESLIQKFLNTSVISYVKDQVDNTGSLRVRTHEFYIPVGAIDVDAEREKILKEIEYQEGFLIQVNKKLSNERFVNNAPEQVVAMERKKYADAEAKLELLRESLSQLG